ncbi:hypothetical protein LRS05_13865 [Flavobacterium sp. J372]|uniref:hypothetical protein n=1 Tax=Flavobacterium sp. J372 TaxID=2898436 RepID=UPI0021513368|nr:hypothetical protein [Flavobacterium sp. J372]MCR5863144.1 hypothetical protein [Flavobacterium sp. J372]
MQQLQMQKDKLDIIEWIKHLEDSHIVEYLKQLMSSNDSDSYVLTEEQKAEVRESHEKYLSGEDKGFTWEEVKERARKRFDEQKP